MATARILETPTGYGVIKVAARKQITLPHVAVTSKSAPAPSLESGRPSVVVMNPRPAN